MPDAILDIVTMLGCRIRIHEFKHDDVDCYRLSLDMEDPRDGRHAEVLLSEDDLTAVVAAVRKYDER